ncbi:MAG: glycosyltransferase, partial [Rhodothermales bacterium]
PFSLVLLEALASGLPVVTASTVGAAGLVTSECGVVLEDPEDARALADAVTDFFGDRTRLEQMGLAARSVAEEHSWASMGARYVDLFEEHLAWSTAAHSTA